MNLLIRAYESSPTQKLKASEVRAYLTHLKNVDGAVGKFSIDSYGNSSHQPVVREIVGSKRRLVESREAHPHKLQQ